MFLESMRDTAHNESAYAHALAEDAREHIHVLECKVSRMATLLESLCDVPAIRETRPVLLETARELSRSIIGADPENDGTGFNE